MTDDDECQVIINSHKVIKTRIATKHNSGSNSYFKKPR